MIEGADDCAKSCFNYSNYEPESTLLSTKRSKSVIKKREETNKKAAASNDK